MPLGDSAGSVPEIHFFLSRAEMWAPSMVHWSCADMFNLTEVNICFSASEPWGYSASQNSEKRGSCVEQLAHLGTCMEKSLHHTLNWTAALDLWHLLKKEVKLSMFKQMLSMFSSYFLCLARWVWVVAFGQGIRFLPSLLEKRGYLCHSDWMCKESVIRGQK